MRNALTLLVVAGVVVGSLWFGLARAANELPAEVTPKFDRPALAVEPVERDTVVQRANQKYRKRYVRCRRALGLKVVKQRGTFQDAKRCRARLTRGLHGDFHKALAWGAKFFGVSYHWLHGCVHQEGGHGPRLIWNLSGSSAYGPGQFMPGTYTRMATGAYLAMKRRGVDVPRSYFFDLSYPNGRYDTLRGQALAMAWGFSQGRSHEWVAPAC